MPNENSENNGNNESSENSVENDGNNENGNKNKKSVNHEIMRAMGLFMQLGFTMAFCILIGFFAGRFLDGLFGTFPVLMIVFSFIGSGAAIKVMYDIVKDWE